MRAELGAALLWLFRNFPLTKIHPHALQAAVAAEAAVALGSFWEMRAMLFAHQEALEPDDLNDYAVQIGLECNAFAGEVAGLRHLVRVRADPGGPFRNSGLERTRQRPVLGWSVRLRGRLDRQRRHVGQWHHVEVGVVVDGRLGQEQLQLVV